MACSCGVSDGSMREEPIDGIDPPPAPKAVQAVTRKQAAASGLSRLRMGVASVECVARVSTCRGRRGSDRAVALRIMPRKETHMKRLLLGCLLALSLPCPAPTWAADPAI